MKKVTTLIFMVGSGFLLSGCIASERDMGTLKLQLRELNDTISVMQTNQAELASRMEELNQNLSVSNENLSMLDGQINKLSAKLDDISAMVRPGTESAAPARAAAVVLPSTLFKESKTHLDKKAYEPAVTGFKLYIKKFPRGENVEEAYMYMGDAHSALKQYKSAAVAYANVLQKFPKSKYTASARLKYARSIIPLGKTAEAKRYLRSVVQSFPKSSEAKMARAELAKLK